MTRKGTASGDGGTLLPSVFGRLTTGYGVRCIQASPETQKHVFIGCKDGRVTALFDVARQLSDARYEIHGSGGAEPLLRPLGAGQYEIPRPASRSGIRAVLALDEATRKGEDQRLLLGREDGSLERWRIPLGPDRNTDPRDVQVLDAPAIQDVRPPRDDRYGHVTFLGWMDEQHILVSHRRATPTILRWSPTGPEEDRLARVGEIQGVSGLVCAVAVEKGADRIWLLVTDMGEIGWVDAATWPSSRAASTRRTGESPNSHASVATFHPIDWWTASEPPALVTDYGVVRQNRVSRSGQLVRMSQFAPARTLLLTTDVGLFAFDLDALVVERSDGRPPRVGIPVQRLDLPGVGVCTALTVAPTHPASDDEQFLWVCDLEENTHLFRYRPASEVAGRSSDIRRAGASRGAFQVVRALATSSERGGTAGPYTPLTVLQAGRNNEALLVDYLDLTQAELRTSRLDDNLRAALVEGNLEEFWDWALGSDDGEPGDGGFVRAMDRLVAYSHAIETLARLDAALFVELLSKGANVLAEKLLLDRLRRGGTTAKTDVKSAVLLWTQTFLGAIARHVPEDRWRNAHLAVLRWIDALRRRLLVSAGPRRPETDRAIREALYKASLFVRKWGLYGRSYRDRASAVQPLLARQKERDSTWEKEDTPGWWKSRQRDEIAYQGRLLHRRWDVDAGRPVPSSVDVDNNTAPRSRARAMSHILVDADPNRPENRQVVAAVAWRRGGVDLYLLDRPREGVATRRQLRSIGHIEPGAENAGRERAVALIGLGNQRFAVVRAGESSTPQKIEDGDPKRKGRTYARLELWSYRPDATATSKAKLEFEPHEDAPSTCELCHQDLEDEKVYSLRFLADGDINDGGSVTLAVGFRGKGGVVRLAFVDCVRRGDALAFEQRSVRTARFRRTDRGAEARDGGGDDSVVGEGVRNGAGGGGDGRLLTAYPEGDSTVAQNPVLALHWDSDIELARAGMAKPPAGGQLTIGCGDGHIWIADLPGGLPRIPDLPSPQTRIDVEFVAELGGQVWCVSRRVQRSDRGLAVDRVYAGGAEGTIACWQRLQPHAMPGADRTAARAPEPQFVPLWATEERSPIASISTYDGWLGPDRNGGRERVPAVVALSQTGTAVLVHDRVDVDVETIHRDDPTRKPAAGRVPGARLDRIDLDGPVFMAAALQEPTYARATPETRYESQDAKPPSSPRPSSDSRFVGYHTRLLLAGIGGDVRVLTLHFPRAPDRSNALHREIHAEWTHILANGEVRGEIRGSARWPQIPLARSRVAETLAIASPGFREYQIRRCLATQRQSGSWLTTEDQHEHFRGVPSYLAPLAGFRDRWVQLNGDDWIGRQKPLVERLTKALRRMREMDDNRFAFDRRIRVRRLFETAVAGVLDLMNRALFDLSVGVLSEAQPATRAQAFRRFGSLYDQLLDALDQECAGWAGAPDAAGEKTRMVLIKRLVDGDTLAALSLADAHLAAPGGAAPDDYRGLVQAMHKRLKLIQDALTIGRPLVALETVRAVNLSLVRAWRRLAPTRLRETTDKMLHRAGTPGHRERWGVPWHLLSGYFGALGDYTSREVAYLGGLGHALAHEIARSYALGVCVCPDAAIAVAYRLREAGLDDAMVKRTIRQIDLLSRLVEDVRNRPEVDLFRRTARWFDPFQIPDDDVDELGEIARARGVDYHLHFSDENYNVCVARTPPAELPGEGLDERMDWLASAKSSEDSSAAFQPRVDRLARALMPNPAKPYRQDNPEMFRVWLPYHDVVQWLLDLTYQLERRPAEVDLAPGLVLHDLLKSMSGQLGPGNSGEARDDYQFRHSLDFWVDRLGTLEQQLNPDGLLLRLMCVEGAVAEERGLQAAGYAALSRRVQRLARRTRKERASLDVRPLVVLLSSRVAIWAADSIDELDERKRTHRLFEPHARLYRETLDRLRRTASTFHQSTAVQRLLVDRVLGHGLLERLDDHAFEFWEIAQALDPSLERDHVLDHRERGETTSRRRFARYVAGRAAQLENAPATLRSMQALIQQDARRGDALDASHGSTTTTLETVIDRVVPRRHRAPWFGTTSGDRSRDELRDVWLDRREVAYLQQAIHELYRNHREHGVRAFRVADADRRIKDAQDIEIRRSHTDGRDLIEFRFAPVVPVPGKLLAAEDDQLDEVEAHGGQQQLPRYPDSRRSSHGSGLYLASLAAAVVGWHMRVGVHKPGTAGAPNGALTVTLTGPARGESGDRG